MQDVAWRAGEVKRSQVNYRRTAVCGSGSAEDSTLVTYHEHTITGFLPGTTDPFQAVWVDSLNHSVSKGITNLQYRFYRASGACDFSGRFRKIADNKSFDQRGQWRGANLWCYQVMAPASGHKSATTRNTVSAFSSERPDRFNGGTHQ